MTSTVANTRRGRHRWDVRVVLLVSSGRGAGLGRPAPTHPEQITRTQREEPMQLREISAAEYRRWLMSPGSSGDVASMASSELMNGSQQDR